MMGCAPAPKKPCKKCGVEKYKITYSSAESLSNESELLEITYDFTFKNDAKHSPACCQFRQNADVSLRITAGPHSPLNLPAEGMTDDGYSRCDDLDCNPDLSDPHFETNDYPGADPLSDSDKIEFWFKAEQKILDVCNSSAVVLTVGPHEVTVTGAVPRAYTGVPKTFESP
jgi:hypothetical protein